MKATFRFGIEEEFFLADATTRGTPRRGLKSFHAEVQRRFPDAERELMSSQVEIASPPSTSFAEARTVLASLRSGIASVGRDHGLLLLASGTHPIARWRHQRRTEKARYDALAEELQIIARRNAVCGMHVHVEVPEPEMRIDLMNRLLPYMPLLLALSASSPFWQGRNTGLSAYRLSVWGEMPRTGLPELFRSQREYDGFVDTMVAAGAIKDASFLWWILRPSIRYPTLELRVADSCTRLDDTLAVAALYRCLVRLVCRRPELNAALTGASRAIVSENMWRCQRDGLRAELIREESRETIACADYLRFLLDDIEPDAKALGCEREVARTLEIVADGTSADNQLALATAGMSASRERPSLVSVADWIADQTIAA